MATLCFSHPSWMQHDTGPDHPECPERLIAIARALKKPEFEALIRRDAQRATLEQLSLIHSSAMIDKVFQSIPSAGRAHLDPDTVVSKDSGEAALHAAGAACQAVDAVLAGQADNAFCAVRPPGHHAEPNHSMGFCLFNNIAIAASHARSKHGIRRVAIVDFDVHHGNGTQAAFKKNPEVLYASTHQHPWYPGTGFKHEPPNIFNCPLAEGSGSKEFRSAMHDVILPAVDAFKPELILVSAGFDAHKDDPLGSLELDENDFAWITRELLALARIHCERRLVSVLEGGYDLDALASSVAAHVLELMHG